MTHAPSSGRLKDGSDTILIKSNNNGTGHSILNFGDDDFNELKYMITVIIV